MSYGVSTVVIWEKLQWHNVDLIFIAHCVFARRWACVSSMVIRPTAVRLTADRRLGGEYWSINHGVGDVIRETRVNNSQYFWRNSKSTNEWRYFETVTLSKLIQIQIKWSIFNQKDDVLFFLFQTFKHQIALMLNQWRLHFLVMRKHLYRSYYTESNWSKIKFLLIGILCKNFSNIGSSWLPNWWHTGHRDQ